MEFLPPELILEICHLESHQKCIEMMGKPCWDVG
jgi:hypothetical protein